MSSVAEKRFMNKEWVFEEIQVECYAGYRGEETPRRFQLSGVWLEVAEVVDRWLSPDHRYFKVRGDDGGAYILRHDTHADRWELTLFEGRPG